jgi:membrane protease YdiL (CAAX protease family)
VEQLPAMSKLSDSITTSFGSLIKQAFFETEKQAAAHIAGTRGFDTKCATVMIVAALSLVFTQYFGIRPGYRMLADLLGSLHLTSWSGDLLQWVEASGNTQIHRLLYWVCIIVAFYICFPALVIKLFLKQKLRDYGFGLGNSFKHYWMYGLIAVVMIPLVILFSFSPRFQQVYPFYKLAPGESLYPYFWVWQVLYLVQFIAVEFFFRGFILHGLKYRFGYYAIAIMVIPYCMIHFGKPMPEAIGAIFAGLALGVLSLATRSIWMGVILHYLVGFTMDIAAVWHRDLF